jgi:hypothetical protein
MTGSIARLRRPHFGLKTLIILIGIFGVVLGVWMSVFEPYRREARVIALATRCNGDVQSVSDAPSWLRAMFGDAAFRRVVRVWLPGDQVTDADLELLVQSPHLHSVRLYNTSRVTNAGICVLHTLPELEELWLIGPHITDDTLQSLRGLSRLGHLRVISDKITDEGLKHLQPLVELRKLELVGPVSDGGMAHLQPLRNLEHLHCYRDPTLAKVVAAIAEPTDLAFIDTPMFDVMEYLGDRHDIALTLHRQQLADEHIDANHGIVTLTLRSPSLYDALPDILDPLNCGWRLDSPSTGLVITTRAELDRSRPELNKLRQELPNLKTVIVDW